MLTIVVLLDILSLFVVNNHENSTESAVGQHDPEWQDWSKQFAASIEGRHNFIDIPLQKRYNNFKANSDFVKAFNARTDRTYTLGLNQFSDMDFDEFRRIMLTYVQAEQTNQPIMRRSVPDVPDSNLPSHLDWRSKGAVTPIKDQGRCGACWAFAAVAALESRNMIQNGNLVSLSEQEVIDCTRRSPLRGNKGCKGGSSTLALQYVRDAGGLTASELYPYQENRSDSCKRNDKATKFAKLDESKHVVSVGSNEGAIMRALQGGPVIAAIHVDEHFKNYNSGVFSNKECKGKLEHVVAIVGYGTDAIINEPYWIVKNSWGVFPGDIWGGGEGGYMRILRGPSNLCGIMSEVIYPIIARPKQMKCASGSTFQRSGAYDTGDNAALVPHRISCRNDEAVSQFAFKHHSLSNFKYFSTCCNFHQNPAIAASSHSTPSNEDRNIAYLDRHNVECPDGKVLSGFQLKKNNSASMHYDYTCVAPAIMGFCEEHYTAFNDMGAQKIYLDRHNVACPDGTLLKGFQLETKWHSADNKQHKMRYRFKCC